MKNLLNCRGRQFRCKFHGKPVEGKIQVEHGYVFLCQNEIDGCRARNKLGYKYSYSVDSGSDEDLKIYNVSDFALLMTAEEIEEYKDWQVGDKITKGRDVFEVIFRSGEVVILKTMTDSLKDRSPVMRYITMAAVSSPNLPRNPMTL